MAAQKSGVVAEFILAGIKHGHHLAVGVWLNLPVVGRWKFEPPDTIVGQIFLLILCLSEQLLNNPSIVIDGSWGRLAGRGAGPVGIPPAVVGFADVA